MIRLEQISKDFGRVRVLDDLTLHIPKGEIFCLVGSSGAGKTTALRIISGVLQPSSGELFIDGFSMAKQPRYAKRQIGYVPDYPYLYERLSGREFLEFHAQLYLLPMLEVKTQIERFTRIFDLQEWLDKQIEEYPPGIRQKIVLTAAFLHNPSVLVLDEPFAALDPASERRLKEQLRLFVASGGSVLLATQQPHHTDQLCQRIGILALGKLLFSGTVAEIKTHHDQDLDAVLKGLTESNQQETHNG
ncbi:MAG: ABC transporter ATP-binding protein [bacterium]